MEMFFLIISISGHPVVMPEKYNKEQCEKIAKPHNDVCIPAPLFPFVTFADPKHCKQIDTNLICDIDINPDTLTPLDKRYPGYYCGSHGSECRLLKVE